jgi:flavin reductase (DIM6/NTAB) family NADH-FMN oxidoreductase RutF
MEAHYTVTRSVPPCCYNISMATTAAASIFARLDREIWLVTSRDGVRRGGLIATFVAQASIVPDAQRVIIGIAKHHHTWELIEASGAFALHLLGEQHLDWVWRFGLESGHKSDKFAGLAARATPAGSPLLPEALAWLDCRVEAKLDTGDRTIFLAEVLEAALVRSEPPLTTRRMLELAPGEKMALLKQQLAHDADLDAAAIRAWRKK